MNRFQCQVAIIFIKNVKTHKSDRIVVSLEKVITRWENLVLYRKTNNFQMIDYFELKTIMPKAINLKTREH